METKNEKKVRFSKIRKILNSEFVRSIGFIAMLVGMAIGFVWLAKPVNEKSENNKSSNLQIEHKDSIIGQYQLRETYKWNDVILWMESKENFEKAYGDSLIKTGHAMLFTKDPMCTGPFGETGDWECEKMCFKYIVPEENPNVINEIAEKSKGKTLVVIGSLFNNGTEFGGNAYWCENKK